MPEGFCTMYCEKCKFLSMGFIIHPCDPAVVIYYLIWPYDIAVCITYLISHSSSLSYNAVIKGWVYNEYKTTLMC